MIRVRRVLAIYGVLDAAPPKVSTATYYAFDDLIFDPLKRELRSAGGALIELTETEVRLLDLS